MDFSIDAILHIFFRLSPFILVCFFSLYSIFNKNIKGIIYLAGLLLACFVTILFGNFPELQKMDKTTGFPVTALNKSCRMIEFTETGPISYLPLGQTVLAFTLFFVGYPIITEDFIKMDFNSRNMTILLFFVALVVADFIWNFSKNCFGIISLLISLIVGGVIGLLWGYVIKKSDNNLQLFRDTSTSKSCETKSKRKHRCRPKVDTKIYPVNAVYSTYISSICSDTAGNIYICSNENGNGIIRKLTYYYPDGANPTIPQLFSSSIIAGTLEPDNENYKKNALKNIGGMFVDKNSNVYFTEKDNHVIWKIDTNGNKNIIAGTSGKSGNSGNGGLATSAKINNPTGICQDMVGNIFFTDTSNNVIKKIDTSGTITLFSGNSENTKNSLGDDNIQANLKNVFFNNPTGICTDSNDNIYISDTGNNRIRIISSSNNVISSVSQSLDKKKNFSSPTDIIVHSNGNITVLNDNTTINKLDKDKNFLNDIDNTKCICIDKQNENNLLYVDAKNRNITKYLQNRTTITYSYDILSGPQGMCFNKVDKSIYVCDTNNHVIRRMDPNMNITTFGGIVGKSTQLPEDNEQTLSNYVTTVKENVSALQTTLHYPTDICVDKTGNIYVTDSSNNVVRKIDTNGVITTRGGNGNDRITSLKATAANIVKINASELSKPTSICVDSEGNVYVTELNQHTIKKIKVDGTISIFAGKDTLGFDNGKTSASTFTNPSLLFTDISDNIFVIDYEKGRIRKISNGEVSTVITASGYNIQRLFIDTDNNLYITTTDHNVVVLTPKNNIEKITYDINDSRVVVGSIKGNTGNTIAKNALLDSPMGICKDETNNLFIVDSNNNVIRKTYQNANYKV